MRLSSVLQFLRNAHGSGGDHDDRHHLIGVLSDIVNARGAGAGAGAGAEAECARDHDAAAVDAKNARLLRLAKAGGVVEEHYAALHARHPRVLAPLPHALATGGVTPHVTAEVFASIHSRYDPLWRAFTTQHVVRTYLALIAATVPMEPDTLESFLFLAATPHADVAHLLLLFSLYIHDKVTVLWFRDGLHGDFARLVGEPPYKALEAADGSRLAQLRDLVPVSDAAVYNKTGFAAWMRECVTPRISALLGIVSVPGRAPSTKHCIELTRKSAAMFTLAHSTERRRMLKAEYAFCSAAEERAARTAVDALRESTPDADAEQILTARLRAISAQRYAHYYRRQLHGEAPARAHSIAAPVLAYGGSPAEMALQELRNGGALPPQPPGPPEAALVNEDGDGSGDFGAEPPYDVEPYQCMIGKYLMLLVVQMRLAYLQMGRPACDGTVLPEYSLDRKSARRQYLARARASGDHVAEVPLPASCVVPTEMDRAVMREDFLRGGGGGGALAECMEREDAGPASALHDLVEGCACARGADGGGDAGAGFAILASTGRIE